MESNPPFTDRLYLLNPPHQRRSQATLNRLLDAAEALLNERAWEDITVSDIVLEAKSSVGSFYARFPSKEALVVALLDRYHEEMRGFFEDSTQLAEWDTHSLPVRARRLIEEVVSVCRRKRGLLRLRLQQRLSTPDSISTTEPDHDAYFVDELARLFETCRQEIKADDYRKVLRFALRMVDGVAIAAIALSDISGSYGLVDDETLVGELTTAFVAYLQA